MFSLWSRSPEKTKGGRASGGAAPC
ncbi:hypothetical protein FQN60_016521 [Etheostoma spectabile]|uniref:Uncharacterized protein n=1 Tax=Etheostoma spectabile TaxID=54343 RepID=A0A5J5D2D5_9PERO|nr:hypothetical protein FQN60_016521 [Etheostoma spectabile]